MSRNGSVPIDRLSVNDLKVKLRDHGMSQAGDKGSLVHRLRLKERCVALGLSGDDDPCTATIGNLRKAAAKYNVSPIGTQDEILTELVAVLEKQRPIDSVAGASNDLIENCTEIGATSNKSGLSAIQIATEVLRLDEYDDHEGILNLGAPAGVRLTRSSPVTELRRAYLKLSLLIHPDKLQGKFDRATSAFQGLVKAFEEISAPASVEDGSTNKKCKQKSNATISRSNEGCYRTRVKCPRCRQPWSEGTLDGNPDYVYNFLMQGLKQYTCSTCLCEFGCMTAIHSCPFCRCSFEYSPDDYHRKIRCDNPKCNKEFGFMLYSVSDRVMNELRNTIREEVERRTKARVAKQRRQQRAETNSQFEGKADAEETFWLGLSEQCPRCGSDGFGDSLNLRANNSTVYDIRKEHLKKCTDTKAHAAFAKEQKANSKRQAKKDAKSVLQDESQQLASWQFLGSDMTQLWLLEDNNLKKTAKSLGITDLSGDKTDLIEKIVLTQSGGGTRITSSSSNGATTPSRKFKSREIIVIDQDEEVVRAKNHDSHSLSSRPSGVKRRRAVMSATSMPSNIYSMSLSELVAFCASHGFKPRNARSKADVLAEIEDELMS